MTALKCYKLLETIFLEIYNTSFGSWAPVIRVYLSYKFDRPETIHDWVKMNLAGHHVWRLSGNKLFQALWRCKLISIALTLYRELKQ